MKKILLITFVLSILLFSPFVVAAPGGAEVTEGATETGTETTVDTSPIEGGNVTYIDTYSQQITGNWAGFFGNVSGSVVLQDASANIFLEWAIDNFDDSVVYATNGSITDWTGTNIVAANSSVVPSYLVGDALDNFTNTFNETDNFNSSSLDKAGIPLAKTWQNGSRGTLPTYALYANTEGRNIWAGLVTEDSDSFKGDTYLVDYQVLVPAQALTTYSFYLELP